LANLGTNHDVHVRKALDPFDQILRHGRAQRTARDHGHMVRPAGEEDDSLSGAVSPADKGDLFVRDKIGLQRRGPIMHRRALELVKAINVEAPVPRARGDDD
jgi:hypothetical protein